MLPSTGASDLPANKRPRPDRPHAEWNQPLSIDTHMEQKRVIMFLCPHYAGHIVLPCFLHYKNIPGILAKGIVEFI